MFEHYQFASQLHILNYKFFRLKKYNNVMNMTKQKYEKYYK